MLPASIPLGGSVALATRFANRHGLIAGATGTGKTCTLATLAEGFSAAGVPVLAVDVKGDLAGLSRGPAPVRFLCPFGREGEAAPLTVAELGPDLFARSLELSDAQRGALDVAFALAEETRRPLRTLADLRSLLGYMAQNARHLSARYGLVTPSSVAAIQRALLAVEREGCAGAFGQSAFDVGELLNVRDGQGLVSVLAAERLMRSPMLYGAALTWILSDLYTRLPEVGDLPRPRLVLLLDEAHLMFADAPRAIVNRVERIIRLIRSKGVGVYFATQAPSDLPAAILGQLGARVQHGLRCATPADERAARSAAETLPPNPRINAAAAIATMGVGQALVSVIGPNGTPTPVELVKVRTPEARLGPVSTAQRRGEIRQPIALPSPPGMRERAVAALMGAGVLLGAAALTWGALTGF